MKIKFEDVKRLYRDYIRSQIPATRSHCPSIESLYASLENRKSQNTKNRIIDHISHCRLCLDEFEIIMSISDQQKRTLTDLIQMSRILQNKNGLAKKKVIYKIANQKILMNLGRITAFSLGILAAAFIVIILFIDGQFFKEMFSHNQIRSPSQNDIILLYPINDMEYSKSSLKFLWKSVPKSSYYIIDIFDDTLFPIWKSPPIFEPNFRFYVEHPKIIRPAKKYFWMVTAIMPNNNKLESDIGFFYLK